MTGRLVCGDLASREGKEQEGSGLRGSQAGARTLAVCPGGLHAVSPLPDPWHRGAAPGWRQGRGSGLRPLGNLCFWPPFFSAANQESWSLPQPGPVLEAVVLAHCSHGGKATMSLCGSGPWSTHGAQWACGRTCLQSQAFETQWPPLGLGDPAMVLGSSQTAQPAATLPVGQGSASMQTMDTPGPKLGAISAEVLLGQV